MSHGKTSSCGVLIGFYGTKTFTPLEIKNDKNGQILMVKAKFDDDISILANMCNSNTNMSV